VTQRITRIDALRGFALIGILQVNLQAWIVGLEPFSTVLIPDSGWLDHLVWLLVSFLITAKFYPIFAFLFGHGFMQQWLARSRRGLDPRPPLTRRYLFLLALGLMHGGLLFFGDILTTYAISGLILVLTVHPNLPVLRRQAWAWLTVYLVVSGLAAALAYGAPTLLRPVPYDFVLRAGDFFGLLLWQLPLFVPQVMLFFVLGALAARIGLLRHPGLHRQRWNRLLRLGLMAGVPASLLYTLLKWLPSVLVVTNPWLEVASSVFNQLCPLMSLAIVALFLRWRGPMASLAAAGQLALSHYLLQSLLMLLLLQVGGLGQILNVSGLALLGLLIAGAQIAASGWYLRHFERGPVEALWRYAVSRG